MYKKHVNKRLKEMSIANKDLNQERREHEKEIVDAAIESGQLMDLWQLSAERKRKILSTDLDDK